MLACLYCAVNKLVEARGSKRKIRKLLGNDAPQLAVRTRDEFAAHEATCFLCHLSWRRRSWKR
jgi:hypothetical protein